MDNDKFTAGHCYSHGEYRDNRANRRAHRFNHPIRMKRINKRKQKQAKR